MKPGYFEEELLFKDDHGSRGEEEFVDTRRRSAVHKARKEICAAVACLVAILLIAVWAHKAARERFVSPKVVHRRDPSLDSLHDLSPSLQSVVKQVMRNDLSNFADYVHSRDAVEERKHWMAVLNQIKRTQCAEYEEANLGQTNWEQVPGKFEDMYYSNNTGLRKEIPVQSSLPGLKRWVCHARHPTRPDVTVSIERSGPYSGHGDNDWRMFDYYDVGHLSAVTNGSVVYVVGGMFAPVDANGKIFGYPPLHIHHAHLFPYGSEEQVAERIKHKKDQASFDHHDIFIQAHGDTECAKAQGGVACLLNLLPEGLGYRIIDSHKGFYSDFTINDVREKTAGLKPLKYYIEHVIYHTKKPQKPVTYFSIGNPVLPALGPGTYILPVDESSTLMYFRFSHKHLGADGRIQGMILHTHQTMFDSFWVFKGSAAFDELEKFRNGRVLPMILECQGLQLNETKRTLFRKLTSVASAICLNDGPNMQYSCKSPDQCGYFQKQISLKCINASVPFTQNEELTIVAFNKAHRKPGKTWKQSRVLMREKTNPYSKHYAAFQHTVVRAVFVPNKAATTSTYVPPGFYRYSFVTRDANPNFAPGAPTASTTDPFGNTTASIERIAKSCPSTISFA